MAYGDFERFTWKAEAGKVLRDKAFNIAKNVKYDGYQAGLASTVYKYFSKKTSAGAVKSNVMLNQQLAEELQKPITRKCEKRKVHSSFIENICGANLGDMLLKINLIKDFDFNYALLIFIANINRLFL